MTPGLQRFLFGLVALLAAVDTAWVVGGHFDVDAPAYAVIAAITLACMAGGVYYDRMRGEPRLSAMLLGTGFLTGISADLSLLNYLLLTVAGHRIDLALAGIDRALGFDWPAAMTVAAQHPLFNRVLWFAYVSQLTQIALLVPLLGLYGRHEKIASFCVAVAAGGLVAIAIWTVAPSFGAFSVYTLPASTHLPRALDGLYARDLVGLLANGPGHISPQNLKGLIGFPSFHATLALLVAWYGRDLPMLRWILPLLCLGVLVSTPIQGGHHMIDVAGGIVVTVLAVWIADRTVRYFAPVPQGALGGLAAAAH